MFAKTDFDFRQWLQNAAFGSKRQFRVEQVTPWRSGTQAVWHWLQVGWPSHVCVQGSVSIAGGEICSLRAQSVSFRGFLMMGRVCVMPHHRWTCSADLFPCHYILCLWPDCKSIEVKTLSLGFICVIGSTQHDVIKNSQMDHKYLFIYWGQRLKRNISPFFP